MSKVSVVIPVYNPEKFIDSMFKSLNQNINHIGEIVLVNNGSDIEFAKLKKMLLNLELCSDNLIEIQAEKKCGPGVARDLGVKVTGFEFIAFFDCDDIWHENHLMNSMQAVEANAEILLTYTDYFIVNGLGEILTQAILPSRTSSKELVLTNYFAMPSIVIRASVAKKYSFGKRGHEDFHFLITLLMGENLIAHKVFNTEMRVVRGHESVSSNKLKAVIWHVKRLKELNLSFDNQLLCISVYLLNAFLKRKKKKYLPVGLFLSKYIKINGTPF